MSAPMKPPGPPPSGLTEAVNSMVGPPVNFAKMMEGGTTFIFKQEA